MCVCAYTNLRVSVDIKELVSYMGDRCVRLCMYMIRVCVCLSLSLSNLSMYSCASVYVYDTCVFVCLKQFYRSMHEWRIEASANQC